jgi:hypothetical protein
VLTLHDGPLLAGLFFLNRPAPRARLWTPCAAPWKNWTLGAVKAGFLVLLLGGQVYGSYQGWYQRGPGAQRSPFAGVYEVESYEINGESRPPLLTDAARWRRFMVTRWGGAIIQRMNDSRDRYMFKHDSATGTVELSSRDGGGKFTLACRVVEKEAQTSAAVQAAAVVDPTGSGEPAAPATVDRLVIEGQIGEDHIKVELKKADDRTFLLTSREFHWVQEFPFNR